MDRLVQAQNSLIRRTVNLQRFKSSRGVPETELGVWLKGDQVEKLLTAVLATASFLALTTVTEAAQSQARIIMTTTAVWDGVQDPEVSRPEPVNDRIYVSMMACRRALANDHTAYSAQMAKEWAFVQGSRNRLTKQLITRSSRARCWIGPLPTQEEDQ